MKSSIRNFAFATSLVAITLSGMPRNAAASDARVWDKPVKYNVHLNRGVLLVRRHDHEDRCPWHSTIFFWFPVR